MNINNFLKTKTNDNENIYETHNMHRMHKYGKNQT